VNAYKSNLAKENNNNFTIHFKKKKAPSDSIAIYEKHYKSKGVIFPRVFGKESIKSAQQLPDKLEYDARLVRKRYGYFYLCIPKKLDKYNGPSQNKVIAFDPGMRTFCTGYGPDGIIVEVGKSDISRIYRLCNSYDKLKSKWSQPTTKHSKRYRYKKAGARIQRRIRNLVDEFHTKQQYGPAKITVLYSYPNLRLRIWFLNVRGKLTQRLLEICLLVVATDSGND
jgi:putative transposase